MKKLFTGNMTCTLAAVVLVTGLGFTTGCQNDAQTGGLIGAGIGAAAGAAIDHNNRGRGALIGGALGGGGGYIVGNERDKARRDNY